MTREGEGGMEVAYVVHGVEGDDHVGYFELMQNGGSSFGAQPLPPPPPPPSPPPYSLHNHIDSEGISDTDNDQYS